MAGGRPRKPPKPKVKVKELMAYIEALPQDEPLKKLLSPDRLICLRKYVEELTYIEYILIRLKDEVELYDPIELYENGSQKTRRTNPALSTYNDMLKTYHYLLRQVMAIIRGIELDIEKTW